MQNVPPRILAVFERQKRHYPFSITLKRINGRYYIYREFGVWNKISKIEKTKTEYLGRITDAGLYLKKKLSAKTDLENAKSIIASHGGEIVWHDVGGRRERFDGGVKLDKTELELLTALSMNSRMPISNVSKLASLNPQNAYYKIKSLEKQFGIKPMLETNIEKLGYTRYLLFAKFIGGLPPLEELEQALQDEPKIQFAALTKGDYDLVVYLIDEGYIDAIDNLWEMRSTGILGQYNARWHLLPFGEVYSFMPLRKAFLNRVVKQKSVVEKLGASRKNGITEREFLVLEKLLENSTKNFNEIDRECSLTKGSSRYSYLSLIRKGIIVRPTITMRQLPMRYLGVFLLETLGGEKVRKNRYKLLQNVIEDGPIANRYALAGNVANPAGTAYFLPVVENGDLEKIAKDMETKINGVTIKTMVISDILVGSLCFRRFDNKHSRQYRLLHDIKKIEKTQPTNYGLMG